MKESMALLERLRYLAMQVVGITVAQNQTKEKSFRCYLNSLDSVEFMETKK